MTPASTTTPYVTAEQFFTYYAYQLAGDMLRATPESPRPSYLAMLDQTNPAGEKLYTFLLYGAGEIESVCLIAKRYQAADLQALTGASAEFLRALNAARSMWAMYRRLKPGTARPEDVPGCKESMEVMKALRDGEMIFGFLETQEAGLPTVNQAQPQQLLTPNVVARASRLFPSYGPNRIWPGSGS